MNGGRLSNDETFFLGLQAFQQQLAAASPDADAAQRALARIAVRYPEEADQLREFWDQKRFPDCRDLLAAVEAQHAAESDED